MRRPWPAWLVGMTLLGATTALPASAEDVPLPRPTPFGRSVEPPPAHRPATVTAANQAAVDAFYREGLKTQGSDNGAPGVRQDYSPNYYAAFLYDPDGNNVEAVYLR